MVIRLELQYADGRVFRTQADSLNELRLQEWFWAFLGVEMPIEFREEAQKAGMLSPIQPEPQAPPQLQTHPQQPSVEPQQPWQPQQAPPQQPQAQPQPYPYAEQEPQPQPQQPQPQPQPQPHDSMDLRQQGQGSQDPRQQYM